MIDPTRLRPHYSAFLRGDAATQATREGRILLTGHSHQAWPDVARAAQLEAFDDAAALVDDKWSRAFEAADFVRAAIASRMGARADEIALAENTHQLLLRFLSALDLREKPHLVTTDGEFHTIDRQLRRLSEEGMVSVTWVPAADPRTLAERLAGAIRAETAAVLCSSVLFQTSAVVPHLADLAKSARSKGTHVLVDAYHAFQVVPFSLPHADAFVVGGGYKYAQLGEGNCFMRVPPLSELRPAVTGWFAGFGALAEERRPQARSETAGGPPSQSRVPYPARPCDRFAGSTYDPTSHYRARAVFRFFDEQGMTVEALRASSLRQTARILDRLDDFEIATPRDGADRGGFVSVRARGAKQVHDALRAEGISTDFRGDLLRLGPAPYTSDDELDRATAALRRLLARAP